MKNPSRTIDRRLTVIIAILIASFFLSLIPFKIIGYGFLPPDDAMRHSAKVVSGKDWGRILVLNDRIKMDSYLGWHTVLGFVNKLTAAGAHSLVLFSVTALFILFTVPPLLLSRYPEAWLSSLVLLAIAGHAWFYRILLGRPFIVTMAVLIAILFSWPKLQSKKIPYGAMAAITFLIMLSTWIHCNWYSFLILISAFLAAREWRAAIYVTACWIIGALLGASLTGEPVLFIKQTLLHLTLVFGNNGAERVLVGELRPTLADFGIFVTIFGLLGWRAIRGRWDKKAIDNPVFILIILGCVLGYLTKRAWLDWGVPAFLVWAALEFEDFFMKKVGAGSLQRPLLSVALAGFLFLAVASDVGSRWSLSRPADYLSAEDPAQREWLPEPEGVIYSDDMGVFYQTFFKNPRADWRYVLGFESALMKPEDLKILRDIQKNSGTYKMFEPWVNKMRREDRLIIRGNEDNKPKIPQLEWKYAAVNTWIGRLPRR